MNLSVSITNTIAPAVTIWSEIPPLVTTTINFARVTIVTIQRGTIERVRRESAQLKLSKSWPQPTHLQPSCVVELLNMAEKSNFYVTKCKTFTLDLLFFVFLYSFATLLCAVMNMVLCDISEEWRIIFKICVVTIIMRLHHQDNHKEMKGPFQRVANNRRVRSSQRRNWNSINWPLLAHNGLNCYPTLKSPKAIFQ